MFFQNIVSTENIAIWATRQIDAMRPSAKYGFDIEIKPHKKTRSFQQNAFYWAVIDHIVKLSNDTGFKPTLLGVMPRMLNRELLHELVKLHFSVPSTAKLSTQEFVKFIDELQFLMIEQSHGEYESIIPPDEYADILNRA